MTTTFDPVTDYNGYTTSWLPLTTVFTAPAGCESAFYASVSSNTTRISAWIPIENGPGAPTLACLPSIVTSTWSKSYSTYTYLSLGPLVCPAQYSTAWTSTYNSDAPARLLVACCPSGFTFWGVSYSCTSPVTSGQVFTVAMQSRVTSGSQYVMSYGGYERFTFNTTSYIYGFNIHGNVPLALSTVTSSSTLTTTTSSRTAPTASATSPVPQLSHGMSQSTKVAIGVGVTLGVLLFIAIGVGAYCLGKYRRRRLQQPRVMHEIYPESEGNKDLMK